MRWLTALLTCWVLAVTAGLLVAVSLPGVAYEQCLEKLRREGEVPDWLWALRIEPGSRFDDVRGQIRTLEAEATVDPVRYIPALDLAPGEPDRWWVYDFGFDYPPAGSEVFTYAPVLCLGGRVPKAVGETVDEAERMVRDSGLTPEGDGDSSWLVTKLSPSPDQIVEFGTQVRITAAPPTAPAPTATVAATPIPTPTPIPKPPTPAALPDLVVEGLVVRAVDGAAQAEGAVVNRGDGDAAGTTVVLRAGDAAPVLIQVPALSVGGTASFNETIQLPAGLTEVTVEVTADPDGLVVESNDQNNSDSQQLVLLSGRGGTTDTQDGGSSGTQETQDQAPARWWVAVVAALLVVAAGALAVRAARHRRGRDWVHRHVRVRVERDPGQLSVQQEPDHTRSHTVRIEPEPGQAETLVEEVEQP